MTDPTHVQFADLVTAFAGLGIDIGLPSRTVSVVIGVADVAIVRQRRDADGGLVVAGNRLAETRTEIAIRYDKEPSACPDCDTTSPAEHVQGIRSSRKGLDSACPQHGRAT